MAIEGHNSSRMALLDFKDRSWLFLNEPCHRVEFRYPVPDLVDGQYILWMHKIENQNSRVEPMHRIYKGPHQMRSKPESADELRYYFVTRADPGTVPPALPNIRISQERSDLDFPDLIAHMRSLENVPAVTALDVATASCHDRIVRRSITAKLPYDIMLRVFVSRKTTFLQPGNPDTTHTSIARYAFRLQALFNPSSWNSATTMALFDLILRRSDKAVLHIRQQLSRHGWTEKHFALPGLWGQLARLSNTDLIESVLRPRPIKSMLLEADEFLCYICKEDLRTEFNSSAEAPVELSCKGRHVFGEDCIRSWLSSKRFEEAKCPLCNHELLEEAKNSGILRGERNGIFHNKDYLNLYQNFEYSCSDLDEDWPGVFGEKPLTGFVRINAKVIRQACKVLLAGARLERGTLTPEHLVAAGFPEIPILLEDVMKFFDCYSDEVLPTAALNSALTDYVKRFASGLEKMFGVSMGALHRLNETCASETCTPKHPTLIKAMPFRPGAIALFEKIVIRALRFQKVRFCGCGLLGLADYVRTGDLSLHKHGDRIYTSIRTEEPTNGAFEIAGGWFV